MGNGLELSNGVNRGGASKKDEENAGERKESAIGGFSAEKLWQITVNRHSPSSLPYTCHRRWTMLGESEIRFPFLDRGEQCWVSLAKPTYKLR